MQQLIVHVSKTACNKAGIQSIGVIPIGARHAQQHLVCTWFVDNCLSCVGTATVDVTHKRGTNFHLDYDKQY